MSDNSSALTCDETGKILIMDGTKEHQSDPYEGERYSIVAFLHNSTQNLSQEDYDTLLDLGFRPGSRVRATSDSTVAPGGHIVSANDSTTIGIASGDVISTSSGANGGDVTTAQPRKRRMIVLCPTDNSNNPFIKYNRDPVCKVAQYNSAALDDSIRKQAMKAVKCRHTLIWVDINDAGGSAACRFGVSGRARRIARKKSEYLWVFFF